MENETRLLIKKTIDFAFTAVPNMMLAGAPGHPASRLSLAAKGLWIYLLCRPDGWVFHMAEILTHTKTGLAAIKTARKELVDAGFLRIERVRGEDGCITHSSWEVLWVGSLEVDYLPMDNQPVENRSHSKKDLNNTDKKGTPSPQPTDNLDQITMKFDTWWDNYPRKVGKPQAWRSWKALFKGLSNKQFVDLNIAIRDGLWDWRQTDSWLEQGGKFIPYPATWLNGERWKDDPGPVTEPVGEVRPEDQDEFSIS